MGDTQNQPENVLKFVEIKRFIFQLENIIEFSKDDASDIDTLIKMTEQCLFQKVGLNPETVQVSGFRTMLQSVIDRILQAMDVKSIEDPTAHENIEAINEMMENDLADGTASKVKSLMRQYFEDLWKQEMLQ